MSTKIYVNEEDIIKLQRAFTSMQAEIEQYMKVGTDDIVKSAPEGGQRKLMEENMEIVHLTKAEFLKKVYNYEANPNDWKYEGDKPAIVDFYATWCGPCKALAPVLEELAKEYAGKVYIYKIDVDKEEELAGAFGIRSIPTLLWIPQSGKPTVTQGALPKPELKKMIDDTLLNSK